MTWSKCLHTHTLQKCVKTKIYKLAKMKLAEIANSVDLDEVAHYEPPHPDLCCLPCRLWISLTTATCTKLLNVWSNYECTQMAGQWTYNICIFLNIHGNMSRCCFSYATTKIQVLGQMLVQTQIGLLLKEAV